MPRKAHMQLNPPHFNGVTIPNGFIPNEKSGQACWYYYLLAQKANEKENCDSLVQYEGDPLYVPKYNRIFRSVCTLYGIEPGELSHHWRAVDMQCTMQRLPKLPERYRFNKIPEIK